jgi:hypothetical protein
MLRIGVDIDYMFTDFALHEDANAKLAIHLSSDPGERNPTAVTVDVDGGFVSREAAERNSGRWG